jgi:hypothetical protein
MSTLSGRQEEQSEALLHVMQLVRTDEQVSHMEDALRMKLV